MKLYLKITLSVIVLIARCLSLNGYLLISDNFTDSYNTITSQNAERLASDVFRVERDTALYEKEQSEQWLSAQLKTNEPTVKEQLMARELYAEHGYGEMFADIALSKAAAGISTERKDTASVGISLRLSNGSPIYSNMPESITQNLQIEAAQNADSDSFRLLKAGDSTYMLISSPLLVNYREAVLISVFDITPLFASRDGQLKSLTVITAATLAVALLLTLLLSAGLTRPIKELKAASERIASGDYTERTSIKTDDEIGAFSKSFDTMACAVEEKVRSLNESIREREDFVSAFTHEIKTPMTSMLGYASILRKGEEEPEKCRAAADYIWRETGRLEALSQKLMALMGLKNEELSLETVSVSALFDSLEKTVPASSKEVSVSSKSQRGTKVLANRVLLDDLLRNLVVNAQRACGDGGQVTVRSEEKDGEVELSVTDNGCGIPKDELDRITEPFYMVDKSRARSENGSGLGLALSDRIAKLHKTALRFESKVGKGTTVSLILQNAKEGEV